MFFLVFDPTFASKIVNKNITHLSLRLVKPRSYRRSESVEVGTFTSEARKKEPFTEAQG
jgi:hypothetical protein